MEVVSRAPAGRIVCPRVTPQAEGQSGHQRSHPTHASALRVSTRADPQEAPVDKELKRLQERLDNQAQASMDLVDTLARLRAWREQYGCQLMHDAQASLDAILDGA